jgi:hypothetical protein
MSAVKLVLRDSVRTAIVLEFNTGRWVLDILIPCLALYTRFGRYLAVNSSSVRSFGDVHSVDTMRGTELC